MGASDEWRWTDEQGVQRVVRTEELRAALASNVLLPSTLVWREGMKEWAPAFTLPELAGAAMAAARTNRGAGVGSAAPSGADRSTPAEVPDQSNAGPAEEVDAPRPMMRTLVGLSSPQSDRAAGAAGAPIVVPAAAGGARRDPDRPAITQLPKFGSSSPDALANPSIPGAPRVPTAVGRAAREDVRPLPLASGAAVPRKARTSEIDALWAGSRSGTGESEALDEIEIDPDDPTLRVGGDAGSAVEPTSRPVLGAARPPMPSRPPAAGAAPGPARRAMPSRPPPHLPPKRSTPPPALDAAPSSLAARPATPVAQKKPSLPPLRKGATTSFTQRDAAHPEAGRYPAPAAASNGPPQRPSPTSIRTAVTPNETKPIDSGRAGREAPASGAPSVRPPVPGAAPGRAPPLVPQHDPPTSSVPSAGPSVEASVAGQEAGTPEVTPAPAEVVAADTTKDGLAGSDPKPASGDALASSPRAPGSVPEPGVASVEAIAPAAARGAAPVAGADPLPPARPRAAPSLETPDVAPAAVRVTSRSIRPMAQQVLQNPREAMKQRVIVPLSSLFVVGGFLIGAVIVTFFVGRLSMNDADTRPTAQKALGRAQDLARAAIPLPPKPCWVARQPVMWAPEASKSIPFELQATGRGSIAVGYARDETQAAGLEFDLASGKVAPRFAETAPTKIESVNALVGADLRFVVTPAMEDRAAVHVAGVSPFVIVLDRTSVAMAATSDGPSTPLWSLAPGERPTAVRVLKAGEAGYAVTFRRANGIWMGWLGPDRKPLGEITRVAGSGGAVGKPNHGFNGRDLAVIFADKAPGGGWQVRIGRAPRGSLPKTTAVFELPKGGPGGDAIAPDIAGLPDGRWLLVWTEGGAGGRAIRAQTLAPDLAALGDPIALSPPAGNFGQGVLGIADAYAAAVFLSRGVTSYELWGAILQCG